MVLEKAFESPLDYKEIKPVNPKENQPWIFIGRTDDEVEAPILWSPDGKGWLIGKRPWCYGRLRAGEEGVTEDEMVWWHRCLNGWVYANSRRQWRTGKPGVLQSMGSQRLRQDWATEQNQQKLRQFEQQNKQSGIGL